MAKKKAEEPEYTEVEIVFYQAVDESTGEKSRLTTSREEAQRMANSMAFGKVVEIRKKMDISRRIVEQAL